MGTSTLQCSYSEPVSKPYPDRYRYGLQVSLQCRTEALELQLTYSIRLHCILPALKQVSARCVSGVHRVDRLLWCGKGTAVPPLSDRPAHSGKDNSCSHINSKHNYSCQTTRLLLTASAVHSCEY
ncbi:unnamed protein product [Ectocarpus sp. 12 AP-2014]